MAKEQRLNFILSLTSDKQVHINMKLHPQMAANEEEFRKLSLDKQLLQSTAGQIGKLVMESMMKLEKEKSDG